MRRPPDDFLPGNPVSGLLAGVLYALVAIGFVLIYKASGVFNYAQGLDGAVRGADLRDPGRARLPFWASFAATAVVILIGAALIERLVLRPLVNRDGMTLFMATLGLSFVIEGLAQPGDGHRRAPARSRHRGHPRSTSVRSRSASSTSTLRRSPARWSWSSVSSPARPASASRFAPVADDTLAAQSIGIRLPTIWRAVWTVAGLVALVAGLLWGARQGVQYSLSFVVLKALPVLIIGGFSSIRAPSSAD